MPLLQQLAASLEQRKAKGMLRNLTIHKPTTLSPTSSLADFSSNDYMSIATSDELKSYFMRRTHQGRIGGSTGSRLLDGNNGSGEVEELEARLCNFFAASDALLCPSGWEANVSLFSTLPQKDDVVLYDSLIHASVHDGMRRTRAACKAFVHNCVEDFERQLTDTLASLPAHANVFVAIESLYSMDGDYAPLPELLAVAHRYLARDSGRLWILIDEAHSGGCFGDTGGGMCQRWHLADRREVIRVCTFGKGFGASGAVILCPSVARHYLINYARPLIFSTAMAHSSMLLIHASLDILESPSGQERRQRLYRNCMRLQVELGKVLEAAGCPRDGEGLFSTIPAKSVTVTSSDSSSGASSPPAIEETLLLRAVCNAAVIDGPDEAPADSQASMSAPRVSPIMPLLTPHEDTRPLATYLQSHGFLVRPITYPTVPLGKDRVRICVHADNTAEEIVGLAGAIRDWLRENRGPQSRASSPGEAGHHAGPDGGIGAAKIGTRRESRM